MPAPSVPSCARPTLTGRAVLVANPAAGAGAGTAEAVAERLQAEVDAVTVTWTTRAGEAGDLAAVTGGLRPTPLAEGVRETLEHYRSRR